MRTEKEQEQILEEQGAWGFVAPLVGFYPEQDRNHRWIWAEV